MISGSYRSFVVLVNTLKISANKVKCMFWLYISITDSILNHDVILSAEILSSTVSKTLMSNGPPEATGTAKSCFFMDNFFDITYNIQSHEFE